MGHTLCIDTLDSLLRIDTSTTKLIEELTGKRLLVTVEYQKEILENDSFQLVRMSKLTLEESDNIIIFSISSFNSDDLTDEQFNNLKKSCIPIGKVFGVGNIKKENIRVEAINNFRIAEKLNVKSNIIYSKKYEFLIKGKSIGIVKEFFNEESLNRIWY